MHSQFQEPSICWKEGRKGGREGEGKEGKKEFKITFDKNEKFPKLKINTENNTEKPGLPPNSKCSKLLSSRNKCISLKII